MLTPKQKMKLRGLANGLSNPYLVGKNEIDENTLKMLDLAFENHELLKVKLLKTSSNSPAEVAEFLHEKLGCDCAQIIGRVLVLYRRSKKNPVIEL